MSIISVANLSPLNMFKDTFYREPLSFSGAHICPMFASEFLLNFIIMPENLGVATADFIVELMCFFLSFSIMDIAYLILIPEDGPGITMQQFFTKRRESIKI